MPAELSKLTDEELIALCDRSKEAITVLIERYMAFIRKKALAIAGNRSDAEDYMQEGFLAFLNAVSTYRMQEEASFSTYAKVCISNRMITAKIKNARTEIPVDLTGEEDERASSNTPETILIEKEEQLMLDEKVSVMLSQKEWQIFRMFLMGSTYDQTARQLNISAKSVDNALQRVRRKLKSVWRADKF